MYCAEIRTLEEVDGVRNGNAVSAPRPIIALRSVVSSHSGL